MAFESAEDFLNSDRRRAASCLVADVQMPGMSGPELYDRLIASGEPIPTIFITAYPDSIAHARMLQDGTIGCLTKPFLEDDFLACIDSAIAASEAKANADGRTKAESGCRGVGAVLLRP